MQVINNSPSPSKRLQPQHDNSFAQSTMYINNIQRDCHIQEPPAYAPVKVVHKHSTGSKNGKEVTFSKVSKDAGILTKVIRLEDSKLIKDASHCRMAKGTIETVTCSVGEFCQLLRQLRPNQAIVHGTSSYPSARLCSKASYAKAQETATDSSPVITRTLKHISYPNRPGLLLLDHDKARDNAVATKEKATQTFMPQELISVLAEIHPEIANAAWVSTPSTSACIFDEAGNELRGEGAGAHIYLFPQDVSDVQRYLKVLWQRLILAGYGRIELSRSGAMLPRTLVDRSVGSPERLDFVAGAVCKDGLEQRLPEPYLHEGGLIDTRSLSELTKAENRRLEAILNDLREQAKPFQASIQETYLKQETGKLAEVKKIDLDVARGVVQTRQKHILPDNDVLYFAQNNGEPVSVSEVLQAKEMYDGKSLADPLEPDYDNGSLTKAKFYWNDGNPKIHSYAHGSITYTFKQFPDDLDEILSDILERTKSDCGVPFEPESVQILAQLQLHDKSRFMQVRAELKRTNREILLKELDKDIRSAYCRLKRSSQSSFSSLSTSYPTSDPSLAPKVLHFKKALIVTGENGRESLVPHSDAAIRIAEGLRGLYAFDSKGLRWHKFEGFQWCECQTTVFDSAVTSMLYAGTDGLGFSNAYESGIAALIQKGGCIPLPRIQTGRIPFQNGLLDLSTGQLEAATPENASTWVLPYEYIKDASCSNFKRWLKAAVEGDEETIRLLRAWLNALLTGRPELQVFLHLVGPAGTGKSTFGRLAFCLVGNENATTTQLKQLENNHFETANIYGKRLVAIEDADKYGGPVNVLKAMTGQDPLRLERKHQQQQGSFIYTGQTLMMSNERLATSDYTSGIERRRITVEFNRRFPKEERAAWVERGGEDQILHTELSGIFNWALEMSSDQVAAIFKDLPERIRKANLEAALYNNPVLNWMLECLLPDNCAATQIGNKQEKRVGGQVVYLKEKMWLYPNYLTWCQRSGHKAVSLHRFSRTLIDAAASYGVTIEKRRVSEGNKIFGLRIGERGEEVWLSALEKRLSSEGHNE